MLRRVATTVLLAAMVGGTALADAQLGGVARQLSMGGGAVRGIAVNPFIWNDPIQMYINPAWGDMYKDYVWINAGGGGITGNTGDANGGTNGYGLQHGGMNFSLGDGIAVGSILSYDPTVANQVAGALAPFGTGVNSGLSLAPVEVLQFMGSYGMRDMSFGLKLLYGWSSNESIATGTATPGTNEYTATVFGAVGGIYMNLGDGNAVEGSVAFSSTSADDKLGQAATPVAGEASGSEFGINARAKLRVNNKVNFIPTIGFGSASGDGTNGGTAATAVDVSGTTLLVGVGADLTAGDFYLAGGLSYFMGSMETTTTPPSPATASTSKSTNTGFPVIQVGGEYSLTDWLTARAGYYRGFYTFGTESTSGSPSVTTEMNPFQGWSAVNVGGFAQDNLVVFGLAGAFGNFGFEATVSEAALRRGFAIIGSSDNMNSFGYLTVNVNVD